MSADEAMRRDHVCRNDPDKKVSHPFLKPTIGVKMEVAGRMSRLLGLTCYYRGGELPSRIVGIARREALGESTDADRDFVKQLKRLVTEMLPVSDNAPTGVLKLLACTATLLGHELEGTSKGDKVAGPGAGRGEL